MNLQEYKESKQELYSCYAKAVKNILEMALADKDYHLQQIQCRAKDSKSLEIKLRQKNISNSNQIENEINDLAGCRIIFYYNNDVNKFISSGIITDNFDINWSRRKIHHSKKGSASVNDYYMADHYIVKLKPERAILAEYKDFAGLWCEIQVHTILNHAWSETNHDIIYKSTNSDGFGSEILKSIEAKLVKVMEELIIPAGYEFQKIQHDYQRLLAGKNLVEGNMLHKIKSSIDNNERYELLERYRDYVVPNFDDIQSRLNDVTEVIRHAIASSKDSKVLPIATPFGNIAGKTNSGILSVCLDILSLPRVRYSNVEVIFSILIELFSEFSNKTERDKINESISKLITYHAEVLKEVGLYVQAALLSILSSWDSAMLLAFKEPAIIICKAILNPTVEITQFTYNQFTIRQAGLSGTTELSNIRISAIQILKKLYCLELDETHKELIIDAFNTATSTPWQSRGDNELLAIIQQNSQDIVNFFANLIPQEDYEILQNIEEHVLFLYRRAQGILLSANWNETVKLQTQSLFTNIIHFRDQLNSNEEFVIYKTLVGFRSVFPPAWENDDWRSQHEKEYRYAKIQEYIASVDQQTVNQWQNRILHCMQAKSTDLAIFLYFGPFLTQLAEKKPDFALQLIANDGAKITLFLTDVLNGLLKSEAQTEVYALLQNWINNDQHLYYCARIFEFNTELDLKLLSKIVAKASRLQDNATLSQSMASITVNYESNNKALLQKLFLATIKELTVLEDTNWLHRLWFRKESINLLSDLNEQQMGIVLTNLLLVKDIDSHVEEILVPLAQNSPVKVVEFFGKRLDIQLKQKDLIGNNYDAIPYEFYKLKEPLSLNPAQTLNTIIRWFDGNYRKFTYTGARLLQIIFPGFPETFENELIELIHTAKEEHLLIVMAILRNYKGESFLHNTCKALIKVLPASSEWLNEIAIILDSTGVISGEFGFVKAYERKKQELTKWLEASDNKVQKFAESHIANLDKRITSETRRVEEEIELRKGQPPIFSTMN